MDQLRGLFMKDWTIIKGYLLIALILDVIIPFGSGMLFQVEFFEGLLVFSGTVMALHALLPIVLLSILFTKDMDRPDIFFHSSASIHKINASKFGAVVLATAISLFWISILTSVSLFFAPDLTEVKSLLPSGAAFVGGILFFSILITVIYYFFLTMFYTMKPRIGGFAYIVTLGLFIFGLETWDRFMATDLYTSITDFWVIQLNDSELLTNIGHEMMMSFESQHTLQMGQLLVSTLLLAILYLIAAYWFDKKVRA